MRKNGITGEVGSSQGVYMTAENPPNGPGYQRLKEVIVRAEKQIQQSDAVLAQSQQTLDAADKVGQRLEQTYQATGNAIDEASAATAELRLIVGDTEDQLSVAAAADREAEKKLEEAMERHNASRIKWPSWSSCSVKKCAASVCCLVATAAITALVTTMQWHR